MISHFQNELKKYTFSTHSGNRELLAMTKKLAEDTKSVQELLGFSVNHMVVTLGGQGEPSEEFLKEFVCETLLISHRFSLTLLDSPRC